MGYLQDGQIKCICTLGKYGAGLMAYYIVNGVAADELIAMAEYNRTETNETKLTTSCICKIYNSNEGDNVVPLHFIYHFICLSKAGTMQNLTELMRLGLTHTQTHTGISLSLDRFQQFKTQLKMRI